MKIGEFSRRYGVSRDTVRYYVNAGLLIPDDQGAQYQFTERECQDMETILRLKGLCFSLKEIAEYLSVLRVSTMVEPESIRDVVDFMDHKKLELEEQIKSLQEIHEAIDAEIYTFSRLKPRAVKKTGLPLAALHLLACPYCGKGLELKQASLDSHYIYDGALVCSCGYQVQIEDGIIRTGNLYTAPYDKPDLKRGLYRNIGENFITYLQKCSDFTLRELLRAGNGGRVILEGHCNGYFFLHNHFQELDPGNIYIITDKYPEILEMYKRNIECLDLNLDIVYIADAYVHYPLRHGCVDILVNFMGDNEHSLYFRSSYLADIKPYLSDEAEVIGSVLGYSPDAKSLEALRRKYPEGDRLGYRRDLWDKIYAQEGYRRESSLAGAIMKSTGLYSFECHQDGEALYMEYFLATPEKKKKSPKT